MNKKYKISKLISRIEKHENIMSFIDYSGYFLKRTVF